MSSLIIFPCLAIVFLMVGRLDLTRPVFVLFALLMTVLLSKLQWFVPGFDAVIATCLTMALANFLAWFIEAYATPDAPEQKGQQQASKDVSRFCSSVTHDYAVSPRDAVFAVNLINNGNHEALVSAIKSMTPAERQGFYANLSYGSASEQSLQEIINFL